MDLAPEFESHVDVLNGVARIALIGELDLAAVPSLEADLALPESNGVQAIMIDARDLTFLDCAGLQALLSARERAMASGRPLLVVGAGRTVRRLCELTGTGDLLDQQQVLGMIARFIGADASGAGLSVAEVNAHG